MSGVSRITCNIIISEQAQCMASTLQPAQPTRGRYSPCLGCRHASDALYQHLLLSRVHPPLTISCCHSLTGSFTAIVGFLISAFPVISTTSIYDCLSWIRGGEGESAGVLTSMKTSNRLPSDQPPSYSCGIEVRRLYAMMLLCQCIFWALMRTAPWSHCQTDVCALARLRPAGLPIICQIDAAHSRRCGRFHVRLIIVACPTQTYGPLLMCRRQGRHGRGSAITACRGVRLRDQQSCCEHTS